LLTAIFLVAFRENKEASRISVRCNGNLSVRCNTKDPVKIVPTQVQPLLYVVAPDFTDNFTKRLFLSFFSGVIAFFGRDGIAPSPIQHVFCEDKPTLIFTLEFWQFGGVPELRQIVGLWRAIIFKLYRAVHEPLSDDAFDSEFERQ